MKATAQRLLAAGAAAWVVACGWSERPRTPFRSVWQAAQSAPLAADEARRLAAAGAVELFLEAGNLGWEGDRVEIRPLAIAQLARETQATLVIGGRWSATPDSARRTAAAWHASLESLALVARAAGAEPVGAHFDLEIVSDRESLAAVLDRLRRELRGRLWVSVTADLERQGSEGVEQLARAVDFVVVDVFGQPPSVADDPERWDLERTAANLEQLNGLGARHAVAAWTLGRAEIHRRRGGVEAIRGALPLSQLLRSPDLATRPGAVFSGIDRQVIALAARDRFGLGPWTLERGDVVRVARPTTHDIEGLLTLAGPPGDPTALRVGVILRHLPPVDDAISLGASSLAAALEPGSAAPALELSLQAVGSSRGRTRLRVRLANRNAEPTDLGGGEWNYAQLEFEAGALGAVDPGDFVGWEQLWRGSEKRTLRALRQADTLRLLAPYVGAGETLESGIIELRARSGGWPEVRTSGRFLLPGGRELVLETMPARWIDGEGSAGRTR